MGEIQDTVDGGGVIFIGGEDDVVSRLAPVRMIAMVWLAVPSGEVALMALTLGSLLSRV